MILIFDINNLIQGYYIFFILFCSFFVQLIKNLFKKGYLIFGYEFILKLNNFYLLRDFV